MKCVCTELVRGKSSPCPAGRSSRSHQPAEAERERARDARAADRLPVGPRQVHVVGHRRIVAHRADAKLIRRGGPTHPFAVRSAAARRA